VLENADRLRAAAWIGPGAKVRNSHDDRLGHEMSMNKKPSVSASVASYRKLQNHFVERKVPFSTKNTKRTLKRSHKITGLLRNPIMHNKPTQTSIVPLKGKSYLFPLEITSAKKRKWSNTIQYTYQPNAFTGK